MSNIRKPKFIVNGQKSNNRYYRPMFFDDLGVDTVEFDSIKFNGDVNAEMELISGIYSFPYLRDNELRLVKLYKEGRLIEFARFMQMTKIKIATKDLFTAGKRLSRLLRPVRFAKKFNDLDIYINEEMDPEITDGITLIHVDLVRRLGIRDPKPNQGYQFTLYFKDGSVKGDAIASDKIAHDIVVFGKDNIKKEVSVTDKYYVSLEPVKMSKKLMLDIQTMLNFWSILGGGDQILEWAENGILSFVDDLKSGKISEWLDNTDYDTAENIFGAKWSLQNAINHQIDYTRYPGLFRMAYNLMVNNILKYAVDQNGRPVFRIPVTGGFRGHFRPDIRNHDEDGNFKSTLKEGEVDIDEFGNIWFFTINLKKYMITLGGCDGDDGTLNVPFIQDGKVKFFIARNPSQVGEYVIGTLAKNSKANLEELGITVFNNHIDPSKGKPKEIALTEKESNDEIIMSAFYKAMLGDNQVEYTPGNLIRAKNKNTANSFDIPYTANAEMLLASIMIKNPKLAEKLRAKYPWSLEKIIDSVKKIGIRAWDDIKMVNSFYDDIVKQRIPIAKILVDRLPYSLREKATIDKDHPVDKLFNELKLRVRQMNRAILGTGSGIERLPGYIDGLNMPIAEFIDESNPMKDIALDIYKMYSRKIAKLNQEIAEKKYPEAKAAVLRQKGTLEAKAEVLERMAKFPREHRMLIVKAIAYDLYSKGSISDTILWIPDLDVVKDNRRYRKAERKDKRLESGAITLSGTCTDMINLCVSLGLGVHIDPYQIIEWDSEVSNNSTVVDNITISEADHNITIDPLIDNIFSALGINDDAEYGKHVIKYKEKEEIKIDKSLIINVYVNKGELNASDFSRVKNITIKGDKARLGRKELKISESTPINDGKYQVLSIVQRVSKKNPNVKLAKGLTVYLA